MTLEGSIAFQEAVSALNSASATSNISLESGLSVIAQFDINAYRNNSKWLTEPYDVCDQNVGQRINELGSGSAIDQTIIGNINEAELMIVSMLIGDGDQYRRGRKAILSAEYTQIGIGSGNLTTVDPIYNFIWAKNFNCTNTCPRVPPTNETYDCSKPMPFTYGSGTALMPLFGLLLTSLLVLFILN